MTSIAIASCPMAMKSDVEGYIAMILAPTYKPNVMNGGYNKAANAYLRAERKVAKYSDDLIYQRGRAYGRADNEIHASLCVGSYLVENGEYLQQREPVLMSYEVVLTF